MTLKSPLIIKTIALFLAAGACLAVTPPVLAKEVIPNIVTVSLLRQSDSTGAAFLRLSTPVALNGCFKVGRLETTTDVEPPFLNVRVKNYTVDADTMKVQAHAPCNGTMQFATADIPLDRKVLEAQHITTVHFALDNGAANDLYAVTMTESNLEIMPQGSVRVFKPGTLSSGGQAAITHWNYPANTLVLTAPVAPADQRDQAVADLAQSAGLTPLETLMPDFVMPSGQDHRHYYVDKDAKFTSRLSATGDTAISDKVYARWPKTQE